MLHVKLRDKFFFSDEVACLYKLVLIFTAPEFHFSNGKKKLCTNDGQGYKLFSIDYTLSSHCSFLAIID